MTSQSESPSDRVFRAYWQDGSLDLFIGLALAAIGVGWLTNQVAITTPIIPVMAVPLCVAFRNRFIEPRLGRVRFDQPRRRQLRQAHVLLIAAGCLTLLLTVVGFFWFREPSSTVPGLGSMIAALPAALLGVGAILSALLFQIHRLALYGIACVAFGVVVALLHKEPGWSLLAGGCVTAIAGAVLLARFFGSFPPLRDEMDE